MTYTEERVIYGISNIVGSMFFTLGAIFTENPGVRLAFMTPLPTNGYALATGVTGTSPDAVNANGNTLGQFADAIIAVCARYSVPVLDLTRRSGFNTYNIPTYTSDGLHPNATGYAAYSPMVGKFVEGL